MGQHGRERGDETLQTKILRSSTLGTEDDSPHPSNRDAGVKAVGEECRVVLLRPAWLHSLLWNWPCLVWSECHSVNSGRHGSLVVVGQSSYSCWTVGRSCHLSSPVNRPVSLPPPRCNFQQNNFPETPTPPPGSWSPSSDVLFPRSLVAQTLRSTKVWLGGLPTSLSEETAQSESIPNENPMPASAQRSPSHRFIPALLFVIIPRGVRHEISVRWMGACIVAAHRRTESPYPLPLTQIPPDTIAQQEFDLLYVVCDTVLSYNVKQLLR